jgi:hypothetical protein
MLFLMVEPLWKIARRGFRAHQGRQLLPRYRPSCASIWSRSYPASNERIMYRHYSDAGSARASACFFRLPGFWITVLDHAGTRSRGKIFTLHLAYHTQNGLPKAVFLAVG